MNFMEKTIRMLVKAAMGLYHVTDLDIEDDDDVDSVRRIKRKLAKYMDQHKLSTDDMVDIVELVDEFMEIIEDNEEEDDDDNDGIEYDDDDDDD